MALVFKGRLGVERYVDSGVTKERPSQQFVWGVMVFREETAGKISKGWEDVTGKDGKVIYLESGLPLRREAFVEGIVILSHSFSPADIGKPYKGFKDEDAIIQRYPESFEREK